MFLTYYLSTLKHVNDLFSSGPPVEYNGQLSSSQVASSPPLLGQHTCEVAETVLGYSKEKIHSLLQNNVLKQSDATF